MVILKASSRKIMYSIEIAERIWYGVKIPKWLRAFDCRGDELPKAPWGRTLWSYEKAAMDLGLLSEKDSFTTNPLSCSTYTDSRTAAETELVRQISDMVREAKKFRNQFLDAKKKPGDDKGHGGSAYYLPVAIAMSNFGWNIICDRRISVTKFFQ
jgi:hypothetical protein